MAFKAHGHLKDHKKRHFNIRYSIVILDLTSVIYVNPSSQGAPH
jgi:predicted transcriptional regulator